MRLLPFLFWTIKKHRAETQCKIRNLRYIKDYTIIPPALTVGK